MSKQYVQHMSGQGPKYLILEGRPTWMRDACIVSCSEWAVQGPISQHLLPKSDYHVCDPPEVWEDVTGECSISSWCGGHPQLIHDNRPVPGNGYRVRKVQAKEALLPNSWAFIVERKKS